MTVPTSGEIRQSRALKDEANDKDTSTEALGRPLGRVFGPPGRDLERR